MFADNPVWGVGLRNFVDNADRYGRVEAGATFVHVAHNSFLQIAAEGGGLAFIVYMTILCSVFWSCNWMRRVARVREDLAWAGVYASMFEAINIGFLVGGTFLNRGHFDLIYHFVSLVGCVTLIVRAEVVSRTQVARSTRDAGVIRVRWRSPLAMGAMPRWERST
jgi:O-antigen ligase